MKNLTRERALELHRQMWSDMQKDLGDNPIGTDRVEYKIQWCNKHFPTEHIDNHCFLCEYANMTDKFYSCMYCPIKWPNEAEFDGVSYCTHNSYYYNAPISEILALPEREDVE